MAIKYLSGNRIVGTAAERVASLNATPATTGEDIVHTAGATTGSRQFIQNNNWSGNVYDHADYQGIVITKAQFYLNYLNTGQPIQCKIFTETSSGVWTTVLASADNTVTGSGSNDLETFNFASGVTTPSSGNGFFVAFNHPDGNDYTPNGVNYVTTTSLISNEIHSWTLYSGSWTEYGTSHAEPRVTNIILTYDDTSTATAASAPNIETASIFEETDTGKHLLLDKANGAWNEIG